ncbi:FAD/NAD(P)-binding protein [Peribacillus huizhouensis]|uniref:Cation diffusion facilitator CzcD-associated flavoprotein CzcO n=1 Tax=Peribacillus huizhouensis TaxID=1501239 RepID=A0ABR6CM12_9BACI|nr:FAD/NAD(P)-binding protein [Peribacillus huizhouensis]MBA9026045.1 cation diffusion facilitator CzcD-associated flavoprotein CzcO [Peribacillus huizhouensis]
MLDCIIVGGGIQGITLATSLLKSGKVTVDQLAIVDMNEEPLARWRQCTEVISMPYLRSPSVHHLDVKPFSLQTYVKKSGDDWNTAFYGRYKRPSLAAFMEHCEHLCDELSIKRAWVQGKVRAASKRENGWAVHLSNGEQLYGRKLFLAIGIGEQPYWPEWAVRLKQNQESTIFHIFDDQLPAFDQVKRPITIIGGGISSVHLALKLGERFPNEVTLLKRHPFRILDFDSDPAWLGPKNQYSFRNLKSYQKRREQIFEARHKGSIPPDLHMKLLNRIKQGSLRLVDGEVESTEVQNGNIMLHDKNGKIIEQTGTILLATGFLSSLPGKEWLSPVIDKYQLRCADCGYPIVSQSLQWGPDLYVTGALAELEIGPIARNISGARHAAERIVASL